MLAYILAIAVGLASLSLYLSAFFLPELHRKDDFLWSGVGLFYALVLWVCAGRVTGGVLLGQSAAVTLMICFGWQTLRLRRAIAHPDEKTDIQGFSLLKWAQNRFKKTSPSVSPKVSETPQEEQPTPEPETQTPQETPVISQVEPTEESEVIAEPETQTPQETPVISQVEPTEEIEVIAKPEIQTPQETPVISQVEPTEESEVIAEPEIETRENKKQGFSLKSLFSLGKSKSQPTTQPPEKINPDADLEESNWDDDDEEEDDLDIKEVTPTLVEATENNQSEPVVETSNISEEESTEQATTEQIESIESYVAEFEPYMADNDAETLIEDYQPISESSEPKTIEKDEEQPIKTEDSTLEVTEESNQETDKNNEEKSNKPSE